MAVSSISSPVVHSPQPLNAGLKVGQQVEKVLETSGNAVGALAVATGALPIPFLAPAAAYFGAKILAKDHPEKHSIAAHASLAAKGLVGAAFGHAPVAGAASTGFRAGLRSAAHAFGKVIPAAVGVVGGVQMASVVRKHGDVAAIVGTHDGRNGAINAVGGALLLVPHPVPKLAGAGVMLVGLGNNLGMMRRLDDPRFAAAAAASASH